jgi:hypothetical protein
MQLINESIQLPEIFGSTSNVEEKRNQLVLDSLAVTCVTDATQQDCAVAAGRAIRTWLKEVESARVNIIAPMLDAQRKISALAKDHCAPLIEEQKRLERMVTSFLEAEARRVAAENEARRVAFEKAEKARIEAEEKARKAAERATTDAGLEKAIKLEEKATTAAKVANAVIASPIPTSHRATGTTLRRVLKWEVTDINALVTARPDLCKIEPKASAIQSTCIPEMPNKPPGLKLWWENTTSIRSF